MIYLNHAGTSFPKPEVVQQALSDFAQLPPTEYGRIFDECQKAVCEFFHIANPERFMFTTSCTSSLAVALSDFPWSNHNENAPNNDCLIISSMEHHALSRWYHKLARERGIHTIQIPRAPDGGPLDLQALERALQERSPLSHNASDGSQPKTLVAMTMASNVTGEILPYEQVVSLCHQYNAYSLLDGAQTAGVIPINLQELNPDMFVFAGHKGTLTIHGLGGLYIAERMNMTCPTAACAYVPAGQEKKTNETSLAMPSYCDTGSAPMMALAGLTAALQWMNQKDFSWEQRTQHRLRLVKQLRAGLATLSDDLEILGQGVDTSKQSDREDDLSLWNQFTGAVSVRLHTEKHSQQQERLREIAQHLQSQDIVASMGFQCAPLTHEALGTNAHGTLRFSVGVFTTHEEIDALLKELSVAVEKLNNT